MRICALFALHYAKGKSARVSDTNELLDMHLVCILNMVR